MADFFQSQFLSWNFGFVAAWGSWPVYNNAPETIYITHRKTPGSDRINDSKKIGGTKSTTSRFLSLISRIFPIPIVSKSETQMASHPSFTSGETLNSSEAWAKWRIWKTTMVSMEIFHLDVSKNRGKPQNGWFIMANPINMDDLGVTLFLETSICHWSFFLLEREIGCWSYFRREMNLVELRNHGIMTHGRYLLPSRSTARSVLPFQSSLDQWTFLNPKHPVKLIEIQYPPWNYQRVYPWIGWPSQKERMISQPSFFSGELLTLGSVHFADSYILGMISDSLSPTPGCFTSWGVTKVVEISAESPSVQKIWE